MILSKEGRVTPVRPQEPLVCAPVLKESHEITTNLRQPSAPTETFVLQAPSTLFFPVVPTSPSLPSGADGTPRKTFRPD